MNQPPKLRQIFGNTKCAQLTITPSNHTPYFKKMKTLNVNQDCLIQQLINLIEIHHHEYIFGQLLWCVETDKQMEQKLTHGDIGKLIC